MADFRVMKRQSGKRNEGGVRRLVVVAHGIGQARAACRAAAACGAAIEIRSAPGAAGYMGPAWFGAMMAELAAEFPGLALSGVLDCGAAPGHALAALRHGLRRLRFTGRGRARARLAEIAAACGASLEGPARGALDLSAEADPEAACRARLAAAREKFQPAPESNRV